LNDRFLVDEKKIAAGLNLFNAHYMLDGGKPKEALKYYWLSIKKDPVTGFREWYRILYIILSPLGLKFTKNLYLQTRKSLKRKE